MWLSAPPPPEYLKFGIHLMNEFCNITSDAMLFVHHTHSNSLILWTYLMWHYFSSIVGDILENWLVLLLLLTWLCPSHIHEFGHKWSRSTMIHFVVIGREKWLPTLCQRRCCYGWQGYLYEFKHNLVTNPLWFIATVWHTYAYENVYDLRLTRPGETDDAGRNQLRMQYIIYLSEFINARYAH